MLNLVAVHAAAPEQTAMMHDGESVRDEVGDCCCDGGDGYGDWHGGAYGDCQLFAVIDSPLHKMCSIRGSNIKQFGVQT
jgi:hypothetical protein